MRKKILIGVLGMMAVLLSACSTEKEDMTVPVEIIEPTTVPADAEPEKQSSVSDKSSDKYREIYRQLVTEMEGDAIIFSLVYLDNDDIPELVVCDRGYEAYSIYTVKDGKAFCMMEAMTTVEMAYFERSSVVSAFARWNGGGDEGGYGWYYYQVSTEKTLMDGDLPTLNFTYDATYDEEGNWTGEGVTKYYHMDQEIDEAAYQQMMNELGIVEGNKKVLTDNALGKMEMLDQLGKQKEGQILDQSFETELDGFGKVVFAPFEPVSYPSENPDYGTTMFGDVRFMLLSASAGEKVYEFPGETEDNILEGFNQFTQVLSVTFRDYNDDGRMDILLLLEYEDASGQTLRKARAYTQDEGETEFRMDRSLSEYLGDYTESMDRILEGISGYWKKAVDPFGETSVWDMERFAKRVRKQILEGDYESLAKECTYPIWIDGESFEDEEALLASGLLQNLPQSFVDVIREETCEDIFHNWRGYMLGNGEVWFEELLIMDLDYMDFSSKGIKIIGFNFILTSYDSMLVPEETSESLTEEEKLLNERMEYYRKSAYYPEIIDYWENVREVRDVSNRIVPLYESDIRYLSKEDLAFDPPVVIHLAKNEIYAHHGYIFKDQDLYNYFMGCIWYTPTTDPEDFSDEVFNEFEKENLKLLDELDTL